MDSTKDRQREEKRVEAFKKIYESRISQIEKDKRAISTLIFLLFLFAIVITTMLVTILVMSIIWNLRQ